MSRVINLQGGGRAEGLSALIRVNAETGSTVSCNGVQGTEKQTPRLPSWLQEVEYLLGDGNAYIDIGLNPTNTLGFEIQFAMPETPQYAWLCGLDVDNDSYGGFGVSLHNSVVRGIKQNYDEITFGTVTDNNFHTVIFNKNNENYLDGVQKTSFTRTYGNYSYHLFLFGRNSNVSGSIVKSPVKVKSAIYWSSYGTNVREYIPCYRKSDNVAGMYDLINETFHTNDGTGAFTVGADHTTYIGGQWDFPVSASLVPNPSYRNLPSGYKQVEYLGASGTQYINLNTPVTSDYDTLCECQVDEFTSGNQAIWGGTSGSTQSNAQSLRLLRFASPNYVYGSSGWSTGTTIVNDTEKHTIETKNGYWWVDGVQTQVSIDSQSNPNTNLLLFAQSDGLNNAIWLNSTTKIFHFVKQGIRDCVPCLNESTNKYGLYDMVSNSFFGNSGTGDFTGGEEVPQFVAPTYTVTATKGSKSASQVVQVDYVGLYEIYVSLSYTDYLYYLGDECEDLTGGWALNSYVVGSSGQSAGTKNAQSIACTGTIARANMLGVTNPISVSGYTGMVAKAKHLSATGSGGTSPLAIASSMNLNNSQLAEGKESNGFINIAMSYSTIYCCIWSNINWSPIELNSVAIYKADDISELAEYGATISAILNNSATLLNDKNGVRAMVGCTGDFMWSAIQNSTWLTAYSTSPYKSFIDGNSAWAKALALL